MSRSATGRGCPSSSTAACSAASSAGSIAIPIPLSNCRELTEPSAPLLIRVWDWISGACRPHEINDKCSFIRTIRVNPQASADPLYCLELGPCRSEQDHGVQRPDVDALRDAVTGHEAINFSTGK